MLRRGKSLDAAFCTVHALQETCNFKTWEILQERERERERERGWILKKPDATLGGPSRTITGAGIVEDETPTHTTNQEDGGKPTMVLATDTGLVKVEAMDSGPPTRGGGSPSPPAGGWWRNDYGECEWRELPDTTTTTTTTAILEDWGEPDHVNFMQRGGSSSSTPTVAHPSDVQH